MITLGVEKPVAFQIESEGLILVLYMQKMKTTYIRRYLNETFI